MKKKHIAVLDFGSQFTHLISRRVRQLGVYAKIYPTDVNAHDLKDAWGIVLSGGPAAIEDVTLPHDPGIFKLDIPMLGICYGSQLIAKETGGEVKGQSQREYGVTKLHITGESQILKGLGKEEQVLMSHWDVVSKPPPGYKVIGHTKDCTVGVMANDELKRYGFQFHPEVHHTKNGLQMYKNFVFDICGAEENWSMKEYLEEIKAEVKELVGDRRVFMLVSGGVDSSVAFALLEEVLGKDRVFGLHVDTGFMRLNESQLVKESLAKAGFDDLHVIDASDRFLLAVEGVADPEKKRRRIGRVFLDAQKDVFSDLEFNQDEWLLGQGTIYPDTIEAGGTDTSHTIKTHHNRVEEIIEMINQGKVVEPLESLYKDEVREVGRELGLPDALIDRWPFPGPGLSIRCLCSDGIEDSKQSETREKTADLEKIEEGAKVFVADAGYTGRRLPLKSVGVQGDVRTYQHALVLEHAADYEWKELEEFGIDLVNKVQGINRLVAHVGGDIDFDKMDLKPGYLTRDRLDLLRQADQIVTDIVHEHEIYDEIWQFPVILLPLTFGDGGETVVLRPIESEEAMTMNFYPLDKKVLKQMVDALVALDGIEAVFFDVTNKPPATIEWE